MQLTSPTPVLIIDEIHICTVEILFVPSALDDNCLLSSFIDPLQCPKAFVLSMPQNPRQTHHISKTLGIPTLQNRRP
jgi:hypothetical protein